jgi:hypothetical protein
MPVIFSSKLTTVLSAKLLNPLISKLFNLTVSYLMWGEFTGISGMAAVGFQGFPQKWGECGEDVFGRQL